MRALALGSICLLACGGPAGAPVVAPARPVRPIATRAPAEADKPPIDPIAALLPDDNAELSWVIPGAIRLELGGSVLAGGAAGRPIEVGAFDRQGNLERVAVWLDHARFSVWVDRAQLLSVLRRDHRLVLPGVPEIGGDAAVVLRAGATVRRLAHREHSTQVRYLGAVQVEGWVPDDLLAERGKPRDGIGRIPTGLRTLMVSPGAVIRSEPRWAAGELAVMASGYFVDALREVDDAWTEVSYKDGDVELRGFVSRRDPPGRVHRWREADRPPTVLANTTVASGTCLYARAGGEPVGYIVGNRAVDLEGAGSGWWTLTIDTPWGPLGFAARGPLGSELGACAPPNAVPPAPPPPAPPGP